MKGSDLQDAMSSLADRLREDEFNTSVDRFVESNFRAVIDDPFGTMKEFYESHEVVQDWSDVVRTYRWQRNKHQLRQSGGAEERYVPEARAAKESLYQS